jgi:peptide-methionine (R)-S-oxide reductase
MADHPTTPDTTATAPSGRALTPLQRHVALEGGTERAFTGEYWNCHDDGTYHCIVCDAPLFTSDTKYESGSGWPSFWQPIGTSAVATVEDRSHGMVRTEARCANCGAHLGHVFPDGPRPTGLRYCMNSASLHLEPATGVTSEEPDESPPPSHRGVS